MKKILLSIANNLLVSTVLFIAIFLVLKILLLLLNLDFRQWLSYAAIGLSVVGIIAGLLQLVIKPNKKIALKIAEVLAVVVISAPSVLFLVSIGVWYHSPEHTITVDGRIMVARVSAFLHTNVYCYDYVGPLFRGKGVRLSVDYGEGAFDPLENNHSIVLGPEGGYTWYDNQGNPIYSSETSSRGDFPEVSSRDYFPEVSSQNESSR